MAPHSRTLAWKIPWMEEPGGLQTMGSQRVGHDWATSLSLFPFMHWRRKWQPTPVFLPRESIDGEAWWAAVHGVAQSWTRLKRLSSSSSSRGKKILVQLFINSINVHWQPMRFQIFSLTRTCWFDSSCSPYPERSKASMGDTLITKIWTQLHRAVGRTKWHNAYEALGWISIDIKSLIHV